MRRVLVQRVQQFWVTDDTDLYDGTWALPPARCVGAVETDRTVNKHGFHYSVIRFEQQPKAPLPVATRQQGEKE